jgi:hypothetical protein
MPPCGGAPYLQRIEQEAELERASSAPMPSSSNTTDCTPAVDTHRAAADLRAVQHHVVGLGDARLPGIGVEQVLAWPSFGR